MKPIEWAQGCKLDKPGIYTGVPFDVYLRTDAVQRTYLVELGKLTAAHARQKWMYGIASTAAQEFGIVFHTRLLEPEKAAAQYAVRPDGMDGRSKGYKAWKAEHAGMILLTCESDAAIEGMVKSAMAHPEARRMLTAEQRLTEPTLIWLDEASGLLCKTRPDLLPVIDGGLVVVDLKTTRRGHAGREKWCREIAQYSYHNQGAMVVEAMESFSHRHYPFIHVVVEKDPPYACAVWQLSEDAIEQGKAENAVWLKRWAECVRTGEWPGYPQTIGEIGLPRWAARDPYEIESED